MKECNCKNCKNELCVKKVSIFSFLSKEELLEIKSLTGHKEFKNGEVLCREGEKWETLFIINEGKVKLSKLTKDGKEQIIHILSSGDFFGELSLFSEGETYNFSAFAMNKVKICTLTKVNMEQIMMKNPNISLKILGEMSKRLAQTENLAQILATNDAEIRIVNMLIEFQEHYGVERPEGIEIKMPINREEMANYTGLTRETISRKLSKLEESGIIELIGNKVILIKDENALREYVM